MELGASRWITSALLSAPNPILTEPERGDPAAHRLRRCLRRPGRRDPAGRRSARPSRPTDGPKALLRGHPDPRESPTGRAPTAPQRGDADNHYQRLTNVTTRRTPATKSQGSCRTLISARGSGDMASSSQLAVRCDRFDFGPENRFDGIDTGGVHRTWGTPIGCNPASPDGRAPSMAAYGPSS